MAYLALAGIGICLAIPVWRSRRAVAGWIWLCTGGAISAGDLVVNAILNLYEYRPGLLPGRADNYLGVLTAECLFVPALYGALAITPTRWRPWLMGAAVPLVTVLEIYFLRVEIYFHHGWHLAYTFGLFGGFTLAAYAAILTFERQGYTRLHRLLQILLNMHYFMNLWGLVPVGIFRVLSMRIGLSPLPEWDLIFSSLFLHALPLNALGIWSAWTRRISRPWIKVGIAVSFFCWLLFLWAMGWYESRPPWNPAVGSIAVLLTLMGLHRLDLRTERLTAAQNNRGRHC